MDLEMVTLTSSWFSNESSRIYRSQNTTLIFGLESMYQ